MITLQEGWGGDTKYYINASEYFYNEGLSYSELQDNDLHGEIGYKMVFTLMPSYMLFQFIFAFFLCGAIFIVLYKFVPRKYWPLFFVFLFIDKHLLMGDIATLARNGTAVFLFLFAVYFLAKGKRPIYVLIILFASFFHKSALFLLPCVLIPSKSIKIDPAGGAITFVFLAVVSAIVPDTWSNLIGSFLSLSDTLDTYSHYIEDESAHYDLTLVLPFVIYWGYIILSNHQRKIVLSSEESLFLNFALITVIFRLLPGFGLSDRLYFYLNYCFFIGMCILFAKMKQSDERIVLICSLLFVFGRWFIMFSHSPHFIQNWMEYNPIF